MKDASSIKEHITNSYKNSLTGGLKLKDSVGLIGKGIEVSGDIKFEGTLRIEGIVNGSINGISGTVSIGEGGLVEADVTANICVVDGLLDGDLTAATRVEITRTGHIKGKVITRELVIAEGAIFEGNLEMAKDSTSITESAGTSDRQTFQAA